MKILLVSHLFSPHTGGIETVVYNQAKLLALRGHDVTVLSSNFQNAPTKQAVDGFRIVRIPSLHFFERLIGVPYPIFGLSLRSTAKELCKHVDIVHAHGSLYPGTMVLRNQRNRQNAAFVLSEHVAFVPYRFKLLEFIELMAYKLVGAPSFRAAQQLFVLTPEVAAHAKKLGAKPQIIKLVPNGVDTKLFHTISSEEKIKLRKKLGLPLKKPIVLFVGRFIEKKGFPSVLKQANENYLTLCVGDGAVADSYRANPHLKFFPNQPQIKLAQFYQAADIFLLPSRGEGFPAAIQEAMACGLPIVTTKNDNYEAHLDTSNFELLSKTDPHSIKTTLTKLLHNSARAKKMAKWGALHAKKHFSWSKHIDALEAAYREVTQ